MAATSAAAPQEPLDASSVRAMIQRFRTEPPRSREQRAALRVSSETVSKAADAALGMDFASLLDSIATDTSPALPAMPPHAWPVRAHTSTVSSAASAAPSTAPSMAPITSHRPPRSEAPVAHVSAMGMLEAEHTIQSIFERFPGPRPAAPQLRDWFGTGAASRGASTASGARPLPISAAVVAQDLEQALAPFRHMYKVGEHAVPEAASTASASSTDHQPSAAPPSAAASASSDATLSQPAAASAAATDTHPASTLVPPAPAAAAAAVLTASEVADQPREVIMSTTASTSGGGIEAPASSDPASSTTVAASNAPTTSAPTDSNASPADAARQQVPAAPQSMSAALSTLTDDLDMSLLRLARRMTSQSAMRMGGMSIPAALAITGPAMAAAADATAHARELLSRSINTAAARTPAPTAMEPTSSSAVSMRASDSAIPALEEIMAALDAYRAAEERETATRSRSRSPPRRASPLDVLGPPARAGSPAHVDADLDELVAELKALDALDHALRLRERLDGVSHPRPDMAPVASAVNTAVAGARTAAEQRARLAALRDMRRSWLLQALASGQAERQQQRTRSRSVSGEAASPGASRRGRRSNSVPATATSTRAQSPQLRPLRSAPTTVPSPPPRVPPVPSASVGGPRTAPSRTQSRHVTPQRAHMPARVGSPPRAVHAPTAPAPADRASRLELSFAPAGELTAARIAEIMSPVTQSVHQQQQYRPQVQPARVLRPAAAAAPVLRAAAEARHAAATAAPGSGPEDLIPTSEPPKAAPALPAELPTLAAPAPPAVPDVSSTENVPATAMTAATAVVNRAMLAPPDDSNVPTLLPMSAPPAVASIAAVSSTTSALPSQAASTATMPAASAAVKKDDVNDAASASGESAYSADSLLHAATAARPHPASSAPMEASTSLHQGLRDAGVRVIPPPRTLDGFAVAAPSSSFVPLTAFIPTVAKPRSVQDAIAAASITQQVDAVLSVAATAQRTSDSTSSVLHAAPALSYAGPWQPSVAQPSGPHAHHTVSWASTPATVAMPNTYGYSLPPHAPSAVMQPSFAFPPPSLPHASIAPPVHPSSSLSWMPQPYVPVTPPPMRAWEAQQQREVLPSHYPSQPLAAAVLPHAHGIETRGGGRMQPHAATAERSGLPGANTVTALMQAHEHMTKRVAAVSPAAAAAASSSPRAPAAAHAVPPPAARPAPHRRRSPPRTRARASDVDAATAAMTRARETLRRAQAVVRSGDNARAAHYASLHADAFPSAYWTAASTSIYAAPRVDEYSGEVGTGGDGSDADEIDFSGGAPRGWR